MSQTRKIKFRAWDINSKEMLNWEQLGIGIFKKHAQNDYILMQFTGLKDQNGVEIYEGDILEIPVKFGTFNKHPKKTGPMIKTIGSVKWDQSTAGYFYQETKKSWDRKIELGNSTDWYRGISPLSECIVIGNIYENPELLNN